MYAFACQASSAMLKKQFLYPEKMSALSRLELDASASG